MKTTKIITTLATLNLILFMSVSTIANPSARQTGDGEKSGIKKQLSAVKNEIEATVSSPTSVIDFSHLRFDVANYIRQSEANELTMNLIDNLRFDVNNFIHADKAETSEQPMTSEFEYLRFDVNNFTVDNSAELSEMPVNEFDYLRFDINKFESENTITLDELPAR